jgi:nicotinamidase-related amidase
LFWASLGIILFLNWHQLTKKLSLRSLAAFYKTALHEVLQANEITHLIITGVTTEVCVQTTIREANDRGY